MSTKKTKEDYINSWEEAKKENQQIDDLTSHRIQLGILKKLNKNRRSKGYYWIAAAVVIAGIFIFNIRREYTTVQDSVTAQTYFSYNQPQNIMLPDGSKIKLQPHSKLSLAADFGDHSRTITFEGKGNFEISKDKSRPFIINAGDFSVQVLGTTFFLDQTKGQERVDLKEGKVKINHQGKITYLLPKESWVQNSVSVLKKIPLELQVREYNFEEKKLSEIISILEKDYQVKIKYPAEIADHKMMGSFQGNLDETLSAISYPFNLKITKITKTNIELK